MAIRSPSTPHGVTGTPVHFTHSAVSQRFNRLGLVLSRFVAAERDLDQVDAFDVALGAWRSDADQARDAVLDECAAIAAINTERAEDMPLRRMALMTRALVLCGSSEEFAQIHSQIERQPEVFTCPGDGATAARMRLMLRTVRRQFDTLAELGGIEPADMDDTGTVAAQLPA